MGVRGTDLAKETADLVLRDDRFATIGAAIEEGRIVYDNIRKFVFYLFSCNGAEILVLVIAGLAAWPLPLLPLQLLWINMITDTFPALALAMEPGDAAAMRQPPRHPRTAILSGGFLLEIAFHAGLITAATLAAFLWILAADPQRAPTAAFMTLALGQSLHLVNARSPDRISRSGHLSNPFAVAGVFAAVSLQLAAAFVPRLAAILHVVPLSAADWLVVGLASIAPALIGQLVKSVRRGRSAIA
jgi:Ca2+-transporting ATPase